MPGTVDRTEEFSALVDAVRARKRIPATAGGAVAGGVPGFPGGDRQHAVGRAQSQFSAAAAEVSLKIKRTMAGLKELAAKARDRQTSEGELARLTSAINGEIKQLSGNLRLLQDAVQQRKAGVAENSFTQQHSENVVCTLSAQLKSATKNFKSILEQRNSLLRSSAERQQREYTAVGLGLGQADPESGGPGTAAVYDGSGFDGALVLGGSGRAAAAGRQALITVEASDATEAFLRSRAEAMRNIERTMVELQDIFTQLTSTLAEQGEMIRRIDTDVEISLGNIQAGEQSIMRVWDRVSSNRGLILKVFGVIIFFIVLFAVLF